MEKLIARLTELAERKVRFTYDLRGECQVYAGVVAAYRATQDSEHFFDLPKVIQHAMAHDGIVGAWKDPDDGRTHFDSCRIFTDLKEALRFASNEDQRTVYNLNRDQEVAVEPRSTASHP